MAQASAEKLEHTGPAEKKEWPQCHRESSWQERQSCHCQKEQTCLSRVPGHKGGRVKVGKSRTLARKNGSELEHGKERVAFTVKESRFQGGKGGQARRASLGEVEGSMRG